jgi:hypothetical protein
MKAAESPDAFVAELAGWKRDLVETLRAAIHVGGTFDEIIKWGNLVFAHNGLCLLIHVEDHRVVFGLFRGKRLTGLEPRIKPSGKYELGNIVFLEGDAIAPEHIERLASEAARLNEKLGDPTALR